LFHHIFEIDLPDNSFLVNGETHDVPCILQIWMKRSYIRDTVEQIEPLNFRFVKKIENPDISFRRVGVNAGTIDTECDSKSIQSHYFINILYINYKIILYYASYTYIYI
jgi:hypothetical protein